MKSSFMCAIPFQKKSPDLTELICLLSQRPLSQANIRLIVDNRLKDYSNRLKLRRIRLLLEDGAKDYLSQVGYSPIYGARPLNKIMREHILNPLAKMILRGDTTEGAAVTIRFDPESSSLVLESSPARNV